MPSWFILDQNLISWSSLPLLARQISQLRAYIFRTALPQRRLLYQKEWFAKPRGAVEGESSENISSQNFPMQRDNWICFLNLMRWGCYCSGFWGTWSVHSGLGFYYMYNKGPFLFFFFKDLFPTNVKGLTKKLLTESQSSYNDIL